MGKDKAVESQRGVDVLSYIGSLYDEVDSIRADSVRAGAGLTTGRRYGLHEKYRAVHSSLLVLRAVD